MPPIDARLLPFLTRKMLEFDPRATLELQVDVSSTSAFTLLITGLTKEAPFSFTITTPTDGIIATHIFGLTDIPLYLSAQTTSSAIERGDVFVQYSLLVNGTLTYTLASGYVERLNQVTWPGGLKESPTPTFGDIASVTTANPAANAEISHSIPVGEVWRIISMSFTVATDANAANRWVSVAVGTAGARLRALAPAAQTANTTVRYVFGPGYAAINNTAGLVMTAPLPQDAWYLDNDTIATITSNLQVGDDISAATIYREKYIQSNT